MGEQSTTQQDRFIMMVKCNIDPAVEEAFNDFYNKRHLGVALKIPGWLSGQRFMVEERFDIGQLRPGLPSGVLAENREQKYIVVYEFSGPEARAALAKSPEAAYSTNDFYEEWAPYLRDVSVTIYRSIGPLTPGTPPRESGAS
jgi:hypothetical protein